MLTAKYTAPAAAPPPTYAQRTSGKHREHRRAREPAERQRAEVEAELVERGPVGAPVDEAHRGGEREGRTRPEQRCACERADGAERDRAPIEHLDRKRLADGDEPHEHEQPRDVAGTVERERHDAQGHPDRSDGGDHSAQGRLQGEEVRRRRRLALGPRRLGLEETHCVSVDSDGWEGELELVDDGLDASRRQALDACPVVRVVHHAPDGDDPVSTLRLRVVRGNVGHVQQLLGAPRVLREARHADRHGHGDRLRGCVRIEALPRNGDADAVGDLERTIVVGGGEEDAVLLAAEARSHVVGAELAADGASDARDDRVSGEVPEAVVDLAQEVEVGHEQRERPSLALCVRRGARRAPS